MLAARFHSRMAVHGGSIGSKVSISRMKGSAPQKLALAELLWKRTTVSQEWMAQKLAMGPVSHREAAQADSMPGSNLAKACAHVLGQWPKLVRVFDYGEVELDTNWAEPKRSGDGEPIGCPKGEAKPSQNSVRPLVLGRKNCLRPCRVRLRRNPCPRSRGRALDARRQLGGRPTRRRDRQCHRILKTPWNQSQGVPRRRPPTPNQRHHLRGALADTRRLTAPPLRPTSCLTPPATAQPRTCQPGPTAAFQPPIGATDVGANMDC